MSSGMLQEAYDNIKNMLVQVSSNWCNGLLAVRVPQMLVLWPPQATNRDNYMMHGFAGMLAFYLWHQQSETTVAGTRLLQQACESFERCNALVPDEPVPTLFLAKVGARRGHGNRYPICAAAALLWRDAARLLHVAQTLQALGRDEDGRHVLLAHMESVRGHATRGLWWGPMADSVTLAPPPPCVAVSHGSRGSRHGLCCT